MELICSCDDFSCALHLVALQEIVDMAGNVFHCQSGLSLSFNGKERFVTSSSPSALRKCVESMRIHMNDERINSNEIYYSDHVDESVGYDVCDKNEEECSQNSLNCCIVTHVENQAMAVLVLMGVKSVTGRLSEHEVVLFRGINSILSNTLTMVKTLESFANNEKKVSKCLTHNLRTSLSSLNLALVEMDNPCNPWHQTTTSECLTNRSALNIAKESYATLYDIVENDIVMQTPPDLQIQKSRNYYCSSHVSLSLSNSFDKDLDAYDNSNDGSIKIHERNVKESTFDEKHSRKVNVLLVEDTLTLRKVLKHYLERIGCEVELACDGQQGFELLTKRTFDIVLSDFLMPNMTGIEMFQAYQSWREKTSSRSILIGMSAATDDKEISDAVEAGMSHFFSKPIRTEKFEEIVDSIRREINLESKNEEVSNLQ